MSNQNVGTIIIVCSLALFFWWGDHFHVFGSKMALNVALVGFFGWIMLAMFGVGYALGGWRAGLAVVAFSAVFIAACAAVGLAWRLLVGLVSGLV